MELTIDYGWIDTWIYQRTEDKQRVVDDGRRKRWIQRSTQRQRQHSRESSSVDGDDARLRRIRLGLWQNQVIHIFLRIFAHFLHIFWHFFAHFLHIFLLFFIYFFCNFLIFSILIDFFSNLILNLFDWFNFNSILLIFCTYFFNFQFS